jgi:hypothetical protein
MATSIDYTSVLQISPSMDYSTVANRLGKILPDLWIEQYCDAASHQANILQISIDGFEHLFDFTSDPTLKGSSEAAEDRLVAVFGFSKGPAMMRDRSRMRGFMGGPIKSHSEAKDKGHFIAHSAGGGLDINLFPQRPELNRGHSDEGKVFRQMERYAAANPGTFMFAHPVYNDLSWFPVSSEYGVLTADLRVWVECFAN